MPRWWGNPALAWLQLTTSRLAGSDQKPCRSKWRRVVAVRRVSVLLGCPFPCAGYREQLGSGEACFVYTFHSACFWGLCVSVCTQSSLTVCDPMDCSPSDSSAQRDSPGKNIGVGCHFLLQGSLPDPGIKPASLASPALAGGFFTTSATWEAPGVYAAAAESLQSCLTL